MNLVKFNTHFIKNKKMGIFQIPKYDPQTGELNPYYAELTGKNDFNQLEFYNQKHNT